VDLKTQFEQAAARAKTLPEQPDEVLLELYGLFKQATSGDVSGDEPGMFDFVGRAKYDAWAARRGLTREEAMERYIARVGQLAGTGR
jgi:acyl-CoA-binding protein